MKKWIGRIHLWIGLPLGVLFFIVSLSGALYTWEPEMATYLYKEKVTANPGDLVTVSELDQVLQREFPQGDFRTVFYQGRSRAFQVLLYGQGTYYHANIDPYTGSLLHLQDMNKGWLNHLKKLHRNLLLRDLGRDIVHWVTLLFLFMVLSGLILWWPQNKSSRKQRFSIKWNASPFRLNYDLHNVLGFYACWILIFSILTGLFWGFDIIKTGLRVASGEDRITYEQPLSGPSGEEVSYPAFELMNHILHQMIDQYPEQNIRITNPHEDLEPVHVTISSPTPLVSKLDHRYFDRYSGTELTGHFEHGSLLSSSTFTRIHGLVYDIHLGNLLGLPGRLLVFGASLIGASLPITGFLIWWKRWRSS